jgi:hypothetical protein
MYENETIRYQCSLCHRVYEHGRVVYRCAVFHPPGSCCHQGEKVVPAEEAAQWLVEIHPASGLSL